jgi:hypothetical protein
MPFARTLAPASDNTPTRTARALLRPAGIIPTFAGGRSGLRQEGMASPAHKSLGQKPEVARERNPGYHVAASPLILPLRVRTHWPNNEAARTFGEDA